MNVTVAILLLPLGRLLFDEDVSLANVVGILVAAVGLVLMNLPR